VEATTRTKRQRPARGEEVELDVTSLAQGGRGVARLEGYVVFVAGAIPGDRVRARVSRSRRAFAEAVSVEVLSPGPDRVEPVCVHGGDPCPGAPWQVLPYDLQIAEKERQVAEALERLGGLEGFEQEPIVRALEPWRYRNKLEYSFGTDGGELALGFHRRGSWSEVVDVDDCRLASERNNQARNAVSDWAQNARLQPYDDRAGTGVLRNLVVREGVATGQVQTRLVTAPGELPKPPVDLHTVVDGPSGGTDGPTGVLGAEHLDERIGELRLRVAHTAFLQTNTLMAERLYALAAEYAGLRGTERVFDLYCGIGTVGLSMARSAGEVWGVEGVADAIADAAHNAEQNEISNARFLAGDVRTSVRPLLEEAGNPDLVVVDPPRAGLSKKIVRRVIECEAPRIVYVSCNPTTLAPNAAQLGEAGYRLRRVRPVDMFPQTPHVECVALLER
jgi:23S rRNA (uracil1939-C5)-methyltransferase